MLNMKEELHTNRQSMGDTNLDKQLNKFVYEIKMIIKIRYMIG